MRRIVVIGLGYVGLPVVRALARAFPDTLGFDRDVARVRDLARGHDPTGALEASGGPPDAELSADPARLAGRDLFVLAVPTPIDAARRPDLEPLLDAARLVGRALASRTRPEGTRPIVVLESTGYPGLTEEVLGPALERASGLRRGPDFALAYSPERINPGDREHCLETVCKVIAAEDEAALEVLAAVYGRIVEAGVHRAPSIRVAEAAKVLENVQRDLNVALVNELAQICDRLGLDTREVLATAATKWNFVPFRPGLVGGHCIGVDPYWLAARAAEAGAEPRVILAGRAVNDGMAAFVARRTCEELARVLGGPLDGRRAGVLGLAFKPGVADARNSRVPEVVAHLRAAGLEVLVDDPCVDRGWAAQVTGLEPVPVETWAAHGPLDLVVLAVPHPGLAERALVLARDARLLVALQGGIEPGEVPRGVRFWRP